MKKPFKFEIQETLSRIIDIEAENIEEAIFKANKMYSYEDIVLSENDFAETKIDEIEDNSLLHQQFILINYSIHFSTQFFADKRRVFRFRNNVASSKFGFSIGTK